ncbi:MAG: helicase-related protein [Candidatus Woesearchaeota archaeon]
MHKDISIHQHYKEHYLNIALDTIAIGKQALIFVNSKPSAEKTAEEIAKHIKEVTLKELAEQILNVMPKPTKQCERLARCIEKGIAFHHAGLHHKQKELIEDAFRDGRLKIIACTPTLAAGLDLPAFRAVLREVKRYSQHGYNFIPVLEYHQIAGRAGRPGKEDFGECITIADTDAQRNELIDRFINGKPESIYSKLAVEPVLRTYILSLISTGFVRSKKDLETFFSKTFWAHQFGDMKTLENKLQSMIQLLLKYKFIIKNSLTVKEETNENDLFVSANTMKEDIYNATPLGKRVSELYLDPLTANYLLNCLVKKESPSAFGLLQMASHTIEMRPLLRVKTKEMDHYQDEVMRNQEQLLDEQPDIFEDEFEEFIDSMKTALFFNDWIAEIGEDELLEKYDIRPGEVHVKLEVVEWLLYSSAELANVANIKPVIKEVNRLRFRLQHGIKEELIPLCRLKNISRMRARRLFMNGIKDLGDVKKADIQKLSQILGNKLALDIKDQVGQNLNPDDTEISKFKRKGQMSVEKYDQ